MTKTNFYIRYMALFMTILFIIFSIVVPPVKAFDLVVTPTVGALVALGCVLLAGGVYIMADDDVTFSSSLEKIWNSMSDNIKNRFLLLSVGTNFVIDVGGDLFNDVTSWFYDKFSESDLSGTNLITTVLSDQLSFPLYHEPGFNWWSTLQTTHFLEKTPQIVIGEYTGFNYTWTFENGLTSLLLDTPSGMQFKADNTTYHVGMSGSNTLELAPFIVENSGFYDLHFPFRMWISGNLYHEYYMRNWKFKAPNITGSDDFFTLYFENGNIFYKTTSGNQIIGNQNDYRSVFNFVHDMTAGQSTIPISIDPNYIPGVGTTAIPIPSTGTIPLNVPATVSEVMTLSTADVITMDIPINPPTTGDDDADKFSVPSIILTKFPFCIPFDLLNSFEMLSSPAVPPVFEYPFSVESIGYNDIITIDFSKFEILATITRWFLSALFIILLIVATRRLVKG